MLGFARNIVFFRVNGGSVAEKSWLARATVSGVAALHSFSLVLRAQCNWWFQVTFSLLWCWCAIVFCMCWDTLCIGTAVLKRCGHFLTSWNLKEASHESFVFISSTWNLKEASHESFVFISSTTGIWKKPRTKASFSHLPLLKFEGRLARKLAFCNSMFADRSGMAASRLLLAAAACVILLRFAAKSRKSHCNGSVRRVKGALGTVFFLILARWFSF